MEEIARFEQVSIDLDQLFTVIPGEYWREARAIRMKCDAHRRKDGTHLKLLQYVAVAFSLGCVYGEDQALDRITYLEDRLKESEEQIRKLQSMTLPKESTQDVKVEG